MAYERRGNIAGMIASRLHGFIFIKTMKTAGTSIEMALSPCCGPDDILTPISVRHDIERAAAGVYPRHFSDTLERRYRKALRKGNPKLMRPIFRQITASGFWAHALPNAIKERVGPFWESALKFTSERHPYEKALSLAYFTFGNQGDFRSHLQTTVEDDPRYVGHAHYIADGKVIVDAFIMHDTVQADFDAITDRLNLPRLQLPKARHIERDRTPARDVLTATQKARIYERCAPEFELFGWER